MEKQVQQKPALQMVSLSPGERCVVALSTPAVLSTLPQLVLGALSPMSCIGQRCGGDTQVSTALLAGS